MGKHALCAHLHKVSEGNGEKRYQRCPPPTTMPHPGEYVCDGSYVVGRMLLTVAPGARSEGGTAVFVLLVNQRSEEKGEGR